MVRAIATFSGARAAAVSIFQKSSRLAGLASPRMIMGQGYRVASESWEGHAALCKHLCAHTYTCTHTHTHRCMTKQEREVPSLPPSPTKFSFSFLPIDLSDSTLSYTETEATNSLITAPGEFSGRHCFFSARCGVDRYRRGRRGVVLDRGLFDISTLCLSPFPPTPS